MIYPIFNSFVNQIEEQLTRKTLNVQRFKKWHEDRINATGLEIIIDVSQQNNFIKSVGINFDWDRFREVNLAHQLNGLEEHPMLQETDLKSITTVSPKIDVELSWNFDETKSQLMYPKSSQNTSLDRAGEWMETISRNVNQLLEKDDVITRWHLDVAGSHGHKHLAAACLISYFQYSLAGLRKLNETHDYVKMRIQDIMIKSQKVRNIADDTLEKVA